MSYTPTEWESTDVVTATRMNALETAVGEMNMSYTPNVWSDGDILTASKMNALEQAVASGGGSSDFSTATVTAVGNGTVDLYCNYINGDKLKYAPTLGNNESVVVPLYKGYIEAYVEASGSFTTSENMYPESIGSDYYYITGDCTITIS